MATVRIKSIAAQYIMEDKDFEYIWTHLNEDLPVMSLNFDDKGKLWSVAIFKPDGCISIFIKPNKVECEVKL